MHEPAAIASLPAGPGKAPINLRLLLARQGCLAEAEQQFKSALGIDANNREALTAHGMVLTRMNRQDEAIGVNRGVEEGQLLLDETRLHRLCHRPEPRRSAP